MILGVDGSNIRTVGSITRLVNLPEAAKPTLHRIVADRELRRRCTEAACLGARDFSWKCCANGTLDFLASTNEKFQVAVDPIADQVPG